MKHLRDSSNQAPIRILTVVIICAAELIAQVAPPPDAGTLARFDANKNGRLDPDELRAVEAEQRKTTTATAVAAVPEREEAVVLSPFEVVADTKGYFAANTMSGTRLNSKLEDLGSSISVVTKEQMADFAMLDINDVFLYALNAEGTGTYTEYDAGIGQGSISDTVSGDPINANRVRGIGSANVSSGNFETSNRVPIDPLDADGVEISRGPNANIFGLGNAAGTVNIVSAAAQLQRDRTQVGLRVDSFDGHRSTLDLNRVLVPGRLGVRVSAVRQRDGFDLKPSGVDSFRYNGMVQFRPFKGTTVKGSYQYYRASGNRPNSLPPLDAITDWRNAGSPTWDPLTSSMKINGVVTRTTTPAYLFTTAGNTAQVFIDRDGLKYWTSAYGVTGTTPQGTIQANRKIVVTRALVNDSQPLIGRRVEMIDDRGVYDWSRINLSSANRFEDQTETARVTVDQSLFNTRRQSLTAQVGWFHEDSERTTRYVMGDGETSGPTGQLGMDVNERLLDGTVNPFFMRPMLAQSAPRLTSSPLRTDTYRGQFAYKVDFTADGGLRRWLGAHSVVGYAEYKDRVQRSYRFQPGIVSDNAWMYPNGATGDRSTNGNVNGIYGRFYVGDNQGTNVDYEPGNYSFGPYTYVWGDATTAMRNREAVVLGPVPLVNGSSGSHAIQKTGGSILQSTLFKGRIVATFGLRNDEHFTKFQNPTRLANQGLSYDYDSMNQWQAVDWQMREGRTEQRGVVAKPFRGLGFLDRRAEGGGAPARFIAGALRGLSLHYNRSDSFKPASPAQNVFGQWLPDPGGKGKDYGFSLNLFDGKLVVRANKYETRQANSRNGTSASLARVMWSMDFLSTAFSLQQEATEWITAANPGITPAQLESELTRVMGVAPRNPATLNAITVSETDDVLGRGHELEIHFNPTNYLTLTANGTEQETINSRLSPNVSVYSAQRLPIWTTVVDPRTNTLWWNTLYGGSETPFQNYRRVFANPLQTANATEGLARPQVRRYRGNASANLRLFGLTQHWLLRRFNVGGSLRYESKGAIGYYGLQQLPAIITDYDYSRPIWDKGHVYFDAFLGYRTKLWANKIGATFQLNVRNLQEGGRLQPIAAYPDGTPNSFRIVSPRQFILSATFDL